MQLKAMLAEQAADIAALKKRLGKDSNNSSKPPSSDRLSKPPRTNTLREKGKNKSGGQTGIKVKRLSKEKFPIK
jgi:transposase